MAIIHAGDIGIVRRKVELEPLPEEVPFLEPAPAAVPEQAPAEAPEEVPA